MKISTQCPTCQTRYSINSDLAGRRVSCKKCGGAFVAATAADTRSAQDTHTSPPAAGARPAVPAPVPTGKKGVPEKFGRYVVRGRLGAGAFGAVYRAFDPRLEREVALKIPRPESLRKQADKERFVREAKSAAQLRHPNIVPVHDAEIEGDAIFITSAFIDGVTLKQHLEQQHEARNLPNAARIVAALAQALDYAHRQKIVHRDVKPANIMLDKQGEPLLMDFGLARLVSAPDAPGTESANSSQADACSTRVGDVMGTPAYMSPEQAAGRNPEVGPASDQYSLGIVLYEMLCGRPPFEGVIDYVLSQVKQGDVPPPRTVNPDIPPDLEAICLKALAREPAARYENCKQFAADLEHWLRGEPIVARKWQLPEQVSRWCRRNPVGAALSGVILTILLLLAVISPLVAAHQANLRSIALQNEQVAKDKEQEAKRQKKAADDALEESRRAEEARKKADDETREAEKRALEAKTKEAEQAKRAAAEAERAGIAAYGQQMTGLLSRVIEGHDIAEDLKSVPGKYRGWEWKYLSKLSAGTYRFQKQPRVTGPPPSGPPSTGAYAPTRFVRLGQLQQQFSGMGPQSGPPVISAMNPQGTRLVLAAKGINSGISGSGNSDLLFFDLTRNTPNQLPPPQPNNSGDIEHLAFDPTGNLLAVLTGGQGSLRRVTIIDLATASVRPSLISFEVPESRSVGQGPSPKVSFSRDGKVVAAGGGQVVAIYHLHDHQELKPLKFAKSGSSDLSRAIWCFQLNRAGTRLYAGGQRTVGVKSNRVTTGSIFVYDVQTEKIIDEFTDLGTGVIDLEISANDLQLAAVVTEAIDRSQQPAMQTFAGPPAHISVRKIDDPAQTPIKLTADNFRPRRVRFSSTSRVLVIDGASSVMEWDLESRRPRAQLPPLIPYLVDVFPTADAGFQYLGIGQPSDIMLGTVQASAAANAPTSTDSTAAAAPDVIGESLLSPPLALTAASGRVGVVTRTNMGVYTASSRRWLWQQPIQIPTSPSGPPGGPPPAVRTVTFGESLGPIGIGFDADLNLLCVGGTSPPWRAAYHASSGALLRSGGPNSFGQSRAILLKDWGLQVDRYGSGFSEFDLQQLQPKMPPIPGILKQNSKFVTSAAKADGSAIVVLRERSVDLFHKQSLNAPRQYDAGTNPVAVGWSETGESVLVASHNGGPFLITEINAATGAKTPRCQLQDKLLSIRQPMMYEETGFASAAFSPDGSRLAAVVAEGPNHKPTPGPVRLYDTKSGATVLELKRPPTASAIVQVMFSSDGEMLLATTIDGKLWIWEAPAVPK